MCLHDRRFSLYNAQVKCMWSFTSAAPHTPWRRVPKNRNFANVIVYVFIIPLLGNYIHWTLSGWLRRGSLLCSTLFLCTCIHYMMMVEWTTVTCRREIIIERTYSVCVHWIIIDGTWDGLLLFQFCQGMSKWDITAFICKHWRKLCWHCCGKGSCSSQPGDKVCQWKSDLTVQLAASIESRNGNYRVQELA
jgi:hypothetical protein